MKIDVIVEKNTNNDDDQESLYAVCLGNRSAVFFYLQDNKQSLSDIEEALKHNYPNVLHKNSCRIVHE